MTELEASTVEVQIDPKTPSTNDVMSGEVVCEVMSTEVHSDHEDHAPEPQKRPSFKRGLTTRMSHAMHKMVHHVPHAFWHHHEADKIHRTPVPDRRYASTAAEAVGHDNCDVTDVPPLAFTKKFAGGLRADIKRRAPYWIDDWIEPLRAENRGQSMASCIFLFFACLSPAVTFGMLFQDGTDGQLGVVEMLLSSGISGLAYAIFSGQPLSIMGATGPELAYTVVFFRMCKALDLEFLPARVWEGLWTALFTTLLAVFDMSALMKSVTRFTEEIFSALISTIFIVEALVNVIKLFPDDTSIEGRARAFMGTVVCFGTYIFANMCKTQRSWRWLTPTLRNIIANYGVTFSIILFTGLSAGAFSDVGIPTLELPTNLEPTYNDTILGRKRDWVVNPMGTHKTMPVWGIFFTAVPAIGLTILGYLDQNLTSLLINRKDHNLRKPPGYHLDLFVCGAFIYPICSIFGLPFTHAATVRSMTHLISLSTREQVQLPDGKGTATKVTKVIEGRTTHFFIHVLLLCAIALAPLLQMVPKAVLYGVFLFMGVGSMAGNQLFDRVWLLLIWDAKQYPGYNYVKNVSMKGIHTFTLFQLFCFGLVYGMVKIDAISVAFPFMIGALIFVRMGMKKCWTADQLHHLDE